jgi:DNA-binding CsgD family transcriptional regulator
MIFDEEKIEGLIARRRFGEASALLALARDRNRLQAAVCAIAGENRGVAQAADFGLLACRSGADVVAHYATAKAEPNACDYLVSAAVLAWSADSDGTYASLEAAHDRALAEQRFDLAVAARERLAYQALLFGEVARARGAIEEAIDLAQSHRFSSWLLRALAVAAQLALDSGDLNMAAHLLARGREMTTSPEEGAPFAPIGAQLAVELGDDRTLREWSSGEIVDIALSSESPEAAIAATIAALIGSAPAPDALVATALRRAMLQADAANAPELFSIAARCGDLGEARLAVAALAAVVSPNRPYLQAHQFLARAQLLLRSGERLGCIDCAGDAARAFSAMGLRRWTNEAMRLLVAQGLPGDRRARGRPTGSALTEREEQVAHLIRRGARNREVAIALQISEHTVERHVSSILGRLGLRSRWQITDPRPSEQD